MNISNLEVWNILERVRIDMKKYETKLSFDIAHIGKKMMEDIKPISKKS